MTISYKEISVLAASTTYTVDLTESINIYKIKTSGTVTLLNNYSIGYSGTPDEGTQVTLEYEGGITLGGYSFTVFGKQLLQSQLLYKVTIICNYNATLSSWTIRFLKNITDLDQENYVGTAAFAMATSGTKTLLPGIDKVHQVVTGSPVLVGNYIITGTGYLDGDTFILKYEGTPTTGGNTVTIFGTTLTDAQAVAGNLTVIAVYNGVTWKTSILNGANAAEVIDKANVSPVLKNFVLTIPVSFVTASQCKNQIVLPYAFEIDYISAAVTTALSNTDAGTITGAINGVAITTGVITIPLSSALNTVVAVTPSAANTGTANQTLDLTSSKVTSGGTSLVTVFGHWV